MSALGHYLERAGIPTVCISLIREHSAAMRPPRSLWVPFELGRPLGAPGDAGFQSRVLTAALDLLVRCDGPLLEDFPDDAPAAAPGDDGSGWVCPVSFPAPVSDQPPGLAEAVAAEVQSLRPWYELAVERRGGRTTVGIAGIGIDEIVTALTRYAESGEDAMDTTRPGWEEQLKYAIDDLLAYYQEAAAAQPGARPSSRDLLAWFWTETEASKLFRRIREQAMVGESKAVRFMAQSLLEPRALEGIAGAAGRAG